MLKCKGCGSNELRKNGIVRTKQRYQCKECGMNFREGDKRVKYTIEQKIRVIKLYTEGMGLRSIERVENIPASLLVHWIRNFSKMIHKELNSVKISESAKEIEIIEMDELFTYYKKRPSEPIYGLLWTETGTKLLISQ